MKNKTKKSKKALIITLSVVVLLVVGAFIARGINKNSSAISTNYTVKKETYENTIEISGNISAAEEQTMQAAGDGTVQKVYVKAGDYVKKGQIIIELDAVEQKYNLAKHEYDIQQTKISGSKRELELMESQKQVLESKIMDRMVIAYFDGIIVSLSVSEGDVVEAKDTVGTIINRDYMSAEVEIVENDVYKLKQNQVVDFTFPAYPDLVVKGYVESFPAVGRITSRGATVVDAVVRIDNPPEQILPNFSFTGKIEITEPKDLLIVERYAIGHKYGKAFVQKVLENGSLQEADVQVEQYNKNYVSILSGLAEGDVLKAQSSESASGRLRISSSKEQGSSKSNNQNSRPMQGEGPGGPR